MYLLITCMTDKTFHDATMCQLLIIVITVNRRTLVVLRTVIMTFYVFTCLGQHRPNTCSFQTVCATFRHCFAERPSESQLNLIGEIRRGEQPVWGLAIVGDKLFLVRGWTLKEQSDCVYKNITAPRDIEVYDSKTVKHERRISVEGLVWTSDMASCAALRCLYLSNWNPYSILRIQLDGDDDVCETTSWSLSNEKPEGISVITDDGNLLVAFPDERKLKEYTTRGEIVKEISLPEAVVTPMHAIQTSDNKYFVCHGSHSDPMTGVYILRAADNSQKDVAIECQVVQNYNRPIVPGETYCFLRLIVDEEKHVLVADNNGKKVLSFNSSLSFSKVLASKSNDGGSLFPVRMCLDERDKSQRLLYVVDGNLKNVAEVLVFKLIETDLILSLIC